MAENPAVATPLIDQAATKASGPMTPPQAHIRTGRLTGVDRARAARG
jgi:hypothetical protein